MHNKLKVKLLAASIAVSGMGGALPVAAQSMALEEIFVTARRKDESVQDVPITVNAVTSDQLNELNIKNFEDLETVVAGLTLDEDTIGASASLRGVSFDVLAQFSASVEFYLNDAPASALVVLQKMFDVERVEVLRGPQGTLRGRATPSGSITVTTAQAETDVFTGFIDTTLATDGDKDIQAAINIPVIEDKLGLRVAGFWAENDINDVSSAYGYGGSEYEGDGARVTLTATPTDDLYINLMYQTINPDRTIFTPVESAYRKGSGLSVPALDLKADDRKSVQDVPDTAWQDLEMTTVNISWDVTDSVQLNYVGAYLSQELQKDGSIDITNAVDATYDDIFFGGTTYLYNDADATSHEFRIQSTELLFDRVEYVLGVLLQEQKSTVVNNSVQYVAGVGPSASVTYTSFTDDGDQSELKEDSAFINLTYMLSDETDFSVGYRKIDLENHQVNNIILGSGASLLVVNEVDESPEIFTASIRHQFSYDVMGYFNWGTSWRAGPNVIGDFSTVRSPTLEGFIHLPPEESESFEVGVKTSWLDSRLRVNAALYHQTFDNFGLYSPDPIYYPMNFGGFAIPNEFSFISPVPVEVNGLEVEVNYVATPNFVVGALLNYSKGEVDGGEAVCNDFDNDGRPDSLTTAPSGAEVLGLLPDQIRTCGGVGDKTNRSPDFSATFTSEYSFDIGGYDAYVRGLLSYYGDSDVNPGNAIDDVDAYSILNLYTGINDPEGKWSAMFYIKNVADEEKVLTRSPTAGIQTITGLGDAVSDYREVSLSAPREIGINLRYNF